MGWIKSGFLRDLLRFNKDEDGYFPISTDLLSPRPEFNTYIQDDEKLRRVLTSPAVLKVFALQCDLFSLGKVYIYKGDKEVEDDPLLKLFDRPNPMQSGSQWLWDFMFWNMIGTASLYVDSNIPSVDNKLYFLDTGKMEFPREMDEWKDKLIFSDRTQERIGKMLIKYTYEDGSSVQLPIGKISFITDLTNGIGNWYKSPSRLDALYKIVCNSEAALDSKNINVRYAGKFMVAGKADIDNPTHQIMGEDEKKDIEQKMNGRKTVYGVKSMIEIKRFVENMAALKLDEAYLNDYFLIGSMYNIPRDVLEAYASSTYENQEKATAKHISYTLEPKGCDLMGALSHRWGLYEAGKKLVLDWSHLPFMQVMEAERAKVLKDKADVFCTLLDQGVSLEEANKFLDTNFTTGAKSEKQRISVNTGK